MKRFSSASALATLLLITACGSPIVGAECRPGFTICDGRCVDLQNDPAQCGSCGNGCGAFQCKAGTCTTKRRPDAGTDAGMSHADAGTMDAGKMPRRDAGKGGLAEAGTGRGGSSTPFSPDGGFKFPDPTVPLGCGIGLTSCGGMCVDTQVDTSHCGDCGTACKADMYCSRGMCVNICDTGLTHCGGGCVDEQTDENNCGSCGNVCVSGICETGVCADTVAGYLIVIGHDYTAPANPAMVRIATNALLEARAPIRALVYRGKAQQQSYDGVMHALNMLSTPWQQINADPDQVSAQLRGATAFIIHAQQGAIDDELKLLGEKWGMALAQFLYRGGVVVLFETPSNSNSGTYKLLSPAGLFLADKREAIVPASQKLKQRDPNTGLTLGVTTNYSATANTVHFSNIMSDGTSVIEDLSGETVIFQSVVVPP